MKTEYPVQIIWSQQDGAYLAIAANLPGCVADGQTPEEALKNYRVVVEEWIETAKEDGRKIPKAMTLEDFSRMQQAAQAKLQKHIEGEVAKAVHQILSHLSPTEPATNPWNVRTTLSGNIAFDPAQNLEHTCPTHHR